MNAQLQREAQLVAGTPPGPDVLQVFVAQGVVAQQVRLALRKDTDGNYLAVCQARETVENGLHLDAVGNVISITALTVALEVSLARDSYGASPYGATVTVTSWCVARPPSWARQRITYLPGRWKVASTAHVPSSGGSGVFQPGAHGESAPAR